MQLAERLGMTVGQMNREMSHAEFQMWLAYDGNRAEECPACGQRADAMMEVEVSDVRCPIPGCGHEYKRTHSVSSFMSSGVSSTFKDESD